MHAQDPIGDIVESTGIGQILRNNSVVENNVGSNIQLYDVAETVNGRMKIEFLDDEELDLIEHTEVYIDEVYYDPNPSLSKMSLRMVQGTARFASGKGNKIKKRSIYEKRKELFLCKKESKNKHVIVQYIIDFLRNLNFTFSN